MCGCLCCKKSKNEQLLSTQFIEKNIGIESATSLPTRFYSTAQIFPPSI